MFDVFDLSLDVQQFGQLLPSTANQAAARNIYEAFAREQLLTGNLNACSFNS